MAGQIYHYTDIAALQGVIENKEVWLTAHDYLNDDREFLEGFDFLEQSLVSRMNNADKQTEKIVNMLISKLKQVVIFSASFSKEPDLLSQWRSYCPEEGGVSIGFDKEMLQKEVCGYKGSNKNNRFLQECCYDPKHSNWVADVISQALTEHFSKGSSSIPEKTLLNNNFLEMLTFLARSKDKSFAEEKEVRLFTYCHEEFESWSTEYNPRSPSINIISPEKVSFRPKKNFLLPFIKVPIPIDAIKEIYVGPSTYQRECTKSLKMYLYSKGLQNSVSIKESATPYRTI